MSDRILEPGRFLQHPSGANRLIDVPTFGRVNEDLDVRAHCFPNGGDAARFVVWIRFVTQPKLYRGETLTDARFRRSRELFQRKAVPKPVTGIRRQAIPVAAKHTIERLPKRLAGGIPQRDIEWGNRVMEQPSRTDPVTRARHPVPRRLDLHHMHADEMSAQLARRGGHRLDERLLKRDDIAEALDAVRGGHSSENMPVGADLPSTCTIRPIQRYA